MLIIAITGGSGAGKTTLAEALARRLDAALIAEDDYYRCASEIAGFDASTHNFDAPSAKDHTLLAMHLQKARAGEAFEKPLYDLVTHRRHPRLERVEPRAHLIVEGLHLLAAPELRVHFDLKIYVDAEENVRLNRRMARDVQSRGRSPEAVLTQFRSTVRPMHDAHVEPQRAFADVVVVSREDDTPAIALAEAERIAALLARDRS